MSIEQHDSIIQILQNCVKTCNECFTACLKENDVTMMAECIRLDRECAEVCGLLEQFLSRGSQFSAELAALCAKICEACASECIQHEHEHCQQCATLCLACAEACRSIA